MSFFDIEIMRDVVFHKGIPILCSQYYGCGWIGDVRSQGISIHDIYLVFPGIVMFWLYMANGHCFLSVPNLQVTWIQPGTLWVTDTA